MQPKEIGIAAASVEEVSVQVTKEMLEIMPKRFDLIAMQER